MKKIEQHDKCLNSEHLINLLSGNDLQPLLEEIQKIKEIKEDQFGDIILHEIARSEELEYADENILITGLLKILDIEGADPTHQNKFKKDTPIHEAIRNKKLPIYVLIIMIKKAYEKGKDLDKKNIFQRTALFEAVCLEHENAVKTLVDYKADTNTSCKELGKWMGRYTCLHEAVRLQNYNIVFILVTNKANVNEFGPLDEEASKQKFEIKESTIFGTPLHKAALIHKKYGTILPLLMTKQAFTKLPMRTFKDTSNENPIPYAELETTEDLEGYKILMKD